MKLIPLGETGVFVKGLRALLQYLLSGSAAHLEQAVVHFDGACPEKIGNKRPGLNTLLLEKYLMYRAYVYERKGITRHKEQLFNSGYVSQENYQFYFFHDPKMLPDVVQMQLQAEDRFILGHLYRGLEDYAADHKARYPAALEALVPRYMASIPMDPGCPKNNYAKRYRLAEDGRSYTLDMCTNLEMAGESSPRRMLDSHKDLKIYHMLIGGFLEPDRRDFFLASLLKSGGVKPGDVVADVGSGPGLFTFPFAEAAGPRGKVIAVDINASVLSYVRYIATLRPKLNVQVHHCKRDNVGLAANSVDVAFVIQTYHALLNFSDPGNAENYRTKVLPWLKSIRKALKSGGRLVLQEGERKIPSRILDKQVTAAGFKKISLKIASDEQIIAVFIKP